MRKEYYLKHREEILKKTSVYYHTNKERASNNRLKRKYGISLAQRNEMFDAQGKKCKICRCDTPPGRRGWMVDHCHSTGRVRGILCQHCNTALGSVKDSVLVLEQCIKYLSGDL